MLVTKSVVKALSANPQLGGQVGETRRFVSITPEQAHRLFESLLRSNSVGLPIVIMPVPDIWTGRSIMILAIF